VEILVERGKSIDICVGGRKRGVEEKTKKEKAV
jgi:hypothetical protein